MIWQIVLRVKIGLSKPHKVLPVLQEMLAAGDEVGAEDANSDDDFSLDEEKPDIDTSEREIHATHTVPTSQVQNTLQEDVGTIENRVLLPQKGHDEDKVNSTSLPGEKKTSLCKQLKVSPKTTKIMKKPKRLPVELQKILNQACTSCGKLFDNVCEAQVHRFECKPAAITKTVTAQKKQQCVPQQVKKQRINAKTDNKGVKLKPKQAVVMRQTCALCGQFFDNICEAQLHKFECRRAATSNFHSLVMSTKKKKEQGQQHVEKPHVNEKKGNDKDELSKQQEDNDDGEYVLLSESEEIISGKAVKRRGRKRKVESEEDSTDFCGSLKKDDTFVACSGDYINWGKKRLRLKHKCPKCSKLFPLFSKLKRHYESHALEKFKRYVCEICSSAFTRPYNLTAHVRKYHESSVAEVVAVDSQYICDICSYTFKSKPKMVQHMTKIHLISSPAPTSLDLQPHQERGRKDLRARRRKIQQDQHFA